ncbi:MAG: IclR family transcriptional regulator, partial [Boseongicola sp.]
MTAESSGGSVRVVERVMRILTCLSDADADTELKLTDISRQTGVHVSTALRFLRTLESGGFVTTGQNGKGWRLGPALIDLRVRAIGQSDIRALAKPIMKEISQRTGETVQLAILVDDSIVYVEKVEPRDIALRINTAIGDRRPVHCTALGKVLAAHSDPAELSLSFQKMEMQRFTPYTITDRAAFKEELAKVRRQG